MTCMFRRPVALVILVPLLSGCLFRAGPRALDAIRKRRPDVPWATVHFRVEPTGADDRRLEELEETLVYWTGAGDNEEPRWRNVLEPHPEDLYDTLLESIRSGTNEITLVSYRYDAIGMDYLTVVDYLDENGDRVGWDDVHYDGLPEPAGGPGQLGHGEMAWWEYPQLLLDYPIYLVIGLKELAGEIVKSPLSAVDTGWIGTPAERRNPLSPVCFRRAARAFVEDWRNGLTALTWRFRVRRQHTPLDLARELLGAMPVVGPVFDHKSPPADTSPPAATSAVVLSQGIHAGDDARQGMTAWYQATREIRPDAAVLVTPYRFGGVFDVVWAILNISNGMGYDAAAQLVFDHGISTGDSVELYGFSGAVQRFQGAARALRNGGITVRRAVGIAGPLAGFSCASESSLLLGDNMIADPVVFTAHLVNLAYFPVPTNSQVLVVPGAGTHHLPYFPGAETRAPESGYRQFLEHLLR